MGTPLRHRLSELRATATNDSLARATLMAEINRLQERHRLEVHIGRARIEYLERQLAATATVSVEEAMAGLALSRPAQELLDRNTRLQAEIRALRTQVVENRTGFVKTLASQRALEHTLRL